MKRTVPLPLDDTHLALLERERRRTGQPRAELIRRAIDLYFRQKETRQKVTEGADDGK